MAAMCKANARQSNHRKGYYQRQRDVTPVNKAIKVARHIARYGDTKQKDVLRAMAKLVLTQAAAKLHKLMVAAGAVKEPAGARRLLLELAK